MIRVTATKIERLMGLGGEVVVNARWLPQFSESLLSLKKAHNDLFGLLETLQNLLNDDEEFRPARHLVFQIREKTRECNLALADRLNQLDMFTSTSANLSDRLYHEVIGVRMRPFADGVQRFPRMVRDLAKQLGKKVRLEILGKATDVDRDILEKLDAPLTHLIRNAIDHGIETPSERLAKGKPETGILRLEAIHRSGMLMITFSDDGRGIDHAKLRQQILDKDLANSAIVDGLTETELMEFLFLPGFSTSEKITEISGRGVGLDVVHDMVHEVGGLIRAMSAPDKGVSFQLELPLTLSVIRTFLVEVAGESYAFPLARIDHCLIVEEHDLETVEDRQYFHFDKNNIALVDIRDILEINETTVHTQGLPVVVISDRSHVYGVVVDKFVGECDLVVRPIDSRLGKVPDISAVAVLLDGAPVLIFDVDDMLRSVDKLVNSTRLRRVKEGRDEQEAAPQVRRILIVDDSITVREMERKILENHGYHVEVAVDGMDGWNAVRTEQFDLVVSDVDMPRMNGIELVTHIKQHDELQSVPVMIISYKDTEEHRLQGLEAGANYYLTKSSFQDDSFINAVIDLIGEAS
jgi:two-component system sensor histidine kinase and response regulator WspE